MTTRAYVGDASPQRPFSIRKIARTEAGRGSTVRPQQDNPTPAVRAHKPRVQARSPRKDDVLPTPKLQDCEIGSVNSALLVPAAVTATTPEHFVDKIEPLHADTVNGNHLAVFLATPSFAPWLLDDSVFVAKALAKLYQNIPGAASLQAVCAVVDRLPHPRPARGLDDKNPIGAARVDRTTHPPINETGVEGIAYVILPHHAALSAQPTVSGEQGSIDFVVHTKTSRLGRDHDRVRVPLANTVFQTGMPSTLITSSWSLSTGGKLDLQSREQLQTMSLDLSAQRLESISRTSSHRHLDVVALSIPLVPLTFPRKVNGHMGNIIRGLEDADGNAMTASTELEQVVPRYFEARGETPQATSAWAVVAKRNTALNILVTEGKRSDMNAGRLLGPERLWTADPPHWNQRIQSSFAQGARLHKVLSGGGGWGKKAGLLSLDPMPIGAPQPARVPEKDGDYETVDEFSTALKPVVSDGDYIQFYISPAVTQDHGADVHGFLGEDTSSDASTTQPWSWEFGVIPSTIDSIPGDSPQKSSEARGEITVHKGVFGALTEGGLTLMRGSDMDEKTGIARKEINTTTIDVPFARWSAMRVVLKEGVKLQSLGELRAMKRKKPRTVKVRSNVPVRDFSTFTSGRPTAAPAVSTIQCHSFSSTCPSSARRAWLPYKQHAQRKLNNVIPPTEQTDPAEPDSQFPPDAVKAILGNLKIPVWKRATITKVKHHFDDVQWAGQKDRNLLIRKMKINTVEPASGVEETGTRRGSGGKMVLYRPGGLEPTFPTSHTSPQPTPNNHLTRGGNARSKHDKRTIPISPKRPDTIVNEWDLDASTWGQSSRSFSTTNSLAKHKVYPNHTRRKKKRQLKRAEEGLPPVLRPVAVPPRPLIRKVDFSENVHEPATTQDDRTIRVRKLFDAQTPLTPPKKPTPRTRTPIRANNPKPTPQTTPTAEKSGLPRLLRQLSGAVPPRKPHERANGEAAQDFAKLEQFLWRAYYRIASSVRKISKAVPPPKKKNLKPARSKQELKQVRKIPTDAPGKFAQQCLEDMQKTGRYIAMLTQQLRSITGLAGRQMPTWIAGRKRGRVGFPSRTTRRRTSVHIPHHENLPHRNPSGLEFTMRRFPLDTLPTTSSPRNTPFHHLLATATHTLKQSQRLAAQTRALLPTAPLPITTHATRIKPRSRRSRGPTHKTPAQEQPRRRRRNTPPVASPRRVPLGGWKRVSKYISPGRGVTVRKRGGGGVVRRVVRKRKGLLGDVEGWLTGVG